MIDWANLKLQIDIMNDAYAAVEHLPCAYCAKKSERPIALGKQPTYRGNVCMTCWHNSIDARLVVYANNR
jgi:hypothetical protein